MENYILQFLKNGIEELRIEKYQQNKNGIAKGLTAFVEEELKKNDIKTELVHYKLWSGDISWELWEGQNPRGLRHEDKRPDMIKITSDKVFSRLTLAKHIKYLNELYNALELEDQDLQTCESCENRFDIDTMEADDDCNYFCPEWWAVLVPQMKADYDEMVKNGEIEENE